VRDAYERHGEDKEKYKERKTKASSPRDQNITPQAPHTRAVYMPHRTILSLCPPHPSPLNLLVFFSLPINPHSLPHPNSLARILIHTSTSTYSTPPYASHPPQYIHSYVCSSIDFRFSSVQLYRKHEELFTGSGNV
jgi:hypothetical protein